MNLKKFFLLLALAGMVVFSTNLYGQTEWEFSCESSYSFNWQGIILDSAGPVSPGLYQVIYCYYEDSLGLDPIGCCTTSIIVEETSASPSPDKAPSPTIAKGTLAYPVPIVKDTQLIVDAQSKLLHSSTESWLEINFEGEQITPRSKIHSVPNAGISGRVIGDINTSPGRLSVLPANPKDFSGRVIMSVDTIGVGGKVVIVNTFGDSVLSLSEDGILYSDNSIQTSAPVAAGAAQNVNGSGVVNIDTALTTLISRSINAPDFGYVLVMASCQARAEHINGITTSINFGVKMEFGSLPSDGDKEWQLPTTLPTGQYEIIVSVQKIFTVGAGDTTFSFVARNISLPAPHQAYDITISLLYVPESYGTVTFRESEPAVNKED